MATPKDDVGLQRQEGRAANAEHGFSQLGDFNEAGRWSERVDEPISPSHRKQIYQTELAQFFREESSRLFRFALHATRGSKEDAEDLVQIVMTELFDSWEQVRGHSRDHLRALAFRRLRSRMVDHWRRTGRDPRPMYMPPEEFLDGVVAAPSSEGYEVAVAKELADAILRVLSPSTREVMARVILDGYTTQEIATELNLTQKAVALHLHRARTTVRRMLTPSDAAAEPVTSERQAPPHPQVARMLVAAAGLSDSQVARQYPEVARLLARPQPDPGLPPVTRDDQRGGRRLRTNPEEFSAALPRATRELNARLNALLVEAGLTYKEVTDRAQLSLTTKQFSRQMGERRAGPTPELVDAILTVAASKLGKSVDDLYDTYVPLLDQAQAAALRSAAAIQVGPPTWSAKQTLLFSRRAAALLRRGDIGQACREVMAAMRSPLGDWESILSAIIDSDPNGTKLASSLVGAIISTDDNLPEQLKILENLINQRPPEAHRVICSVVTEYPDRIKALVAQPEACISAPRLTQRVGELLLDQAQQHRKQAELGQQVVQQRTGYKPPAGIDAPLRAPWAALATAPEGEVRGETRTAGAAGRAGLSGGL